RPQRRPSADALCQQRPPSLPCACVVAVPGRSVADVLVCCVALPSVPLSSCSGTSRAAGSQSRGTTPQPATRPESWGQSAQSVSCHRPHAFQKLSNQGVVFGVATLIGVSQEQLGQRLP